MNKTKKGNQVQQKILELLLLKPNALNKEIYLLSHLDGTGKKRKAPGKNSSESSSQLDETTEADKTLEVNLDLSH